MKKLTILTVVIVGILISITSLDANAKKVSKRKLIGTWQLCNADSTVATNLHDQGFVRYKTIANESFTVIDIFKDDKEIHGSFWGSYSLEKNVYNEFIQYTSPNWKNLFGVKNSFEIYIKGDLLFIKGTNNPYSEIWKKVND